MDYELAKELKDAGFSQEHGGGQYLVEGHISIKDGLTESSPAYAPTLEELIDACGIGFGALGLDSERTFEQKPFYACAVVTKQGEWLGPYGHGSAPTEAVARLWLSLNKGL